MAALNHVCMWSENGWIRVTAEQAAVLHPGGTVSAHSGLFMCEICGQYVTLTDGDRVTRYFKHSAYESDKNCPERTFGVGYKPQIDPKEHELPLKIVVTENKIEFSIGLLYIPKEELIANNLRRISITPFGNDSDVYTYSIERLNEDMITYLPVGIEPALSYRIESMPIFNNIWPQTVKGVTKQGKIFDLTTGRMLLDDADVCVGREYYLLTTRNVNCGDINARKVVERIGKNGVWKLYVISAQYMTEDAAKFFLDIHYRLCVMPIEVQTIWPPYIQSPYVIKHNEPTVVLFSNSTDEIFVNVFPETGIQKFLIPSQKRVFKVDCKERQQLISAGRTRNFRYNYYWKDSLLECSINTALEVFDGKNNLLVEGVYKKIPALGIISFVPIYDGFIIVRDKQGIIEKRNITADGIIKEINNIKLGYEVEIYQGLDVVWKASFIKVDKKHTISDDELLSILKNSIGEKTKMLHSYGAAAIHLKDYPKTKEWLRQQIKSGCISRTALNYLKTFVREERTEINEKIW